MLERQREQFESNPSNRAAFAALQEKAITSPGSGTR